MGNACATEGTSDADFTDYFGVPLQDLVAYESRIRGTAYPCGSIVPFLLQDIATALQTAPVIGRPSEVKVQNGVDNKSMASSMNSMTMSVNSSAPVHPQLRTQSMTGFHFDHSQQYDEKSVSRLQQIKNAVVETAKVYKTHGSVASKFIVFGETLIDKQNCSRVELLNVLLLFLVALPNRPLTNQLCDEIDERMKAYEKAQADKEAAEAESKTASAASTPVANNAEAAATKHMPLSANNKRLAHQQAIHDRDELAKSRWRIARTVLKVITIEALEKAAVKSDNALFSKYPHLRKAEEKGMKRRKSDASKLDPKQQSIDNNTQFVSEIKEESTLYGHFRPTVHPNLANLATNSRRQSSKQQTAASATAANVASESVSKSNGTNLTDPYDMNGPGAGFGTLYTNANVQDTNTKKGSNSSSSTKKRFLAPVDHPNHPSVRLFFWVLALFNEMAPESHMITFEQCCTVVAALCEDRPSLDAQQALASERDIAVITHFGGDKNKVPVQHLVSVEIRGTGRNFNVLHPLETLKVTERVRRITQALLTGFCHRRPERLCRPEPHSDVAENERQIKAVLGHDATGQPSTAAKAVDVAAVATAVNFFPLVPGNNAVMMSVELSSALSHTAPQSAISSPNRNGKTVTVLDGPTAGPPTLIYGVNAPTLVYGNNHGDREDDDEDGPENDTASMTASAHTMAKLAAAAAKNADGKTTNTSKGAVANNERLNADNNKVKHKRLPSQITEHLSGPNWPHQGSQDTSAILQTSSDSLRTGSPASDNHTVNNRNFKASGNVTRESSAESNQNNAGYTTNRTHATSGMLADVEVSKHISPTTHRLEEADSEFLEVARAGNDNPQHMRGPTRAEDAEREMPSQPASGEHPAFFFNGTKLQKRLAAAKQGFLSGRVRDLEFSPTEGGSPKAFAEATWDRAAEGMLGPGVAGALRRLDEESAATAPRPSSAGSARSQLQELLAQLRDPMDGVTGLPQSMKALPMKRTPPPVVRKDTIAQSGMANANAADDENEELKFRQLCAVVELLEKDNGRLRGDLGSAMDDIGDAMERLHRDHTTLKGMVGRSTAHKAFRERVQTILAEVADSQVTITEDATTIRREVRELREALLGAERDRGNLADEVLALRAELESSKARWGLTERDVLKHDQALTVVDRRVAEVMHRGRSIEGELKGVQFGQEVLMRKDGITSVAGPFSSMADDANASGGGALYSAEYFRSLQTTNNYNKNNTNNNQHAPANPYIFSGSDGGVTGALGEFLRVGGPSPSAANRRPSYLN